MTDILSYSNSNSSSTASSESDRNSTSDSDSTSSDLEDSDDFEDDYLLIPYGQMDEAVREALLKEMFMGDQAVGCAGVPKFWWNMICQIWTDRVVRSDLCRKENEILTELEQIKNWIDNWNNLNDFDLGV